MKSFNADFERTTNQLAPKFYLGACRGKLRFHGHINNFPFPSRSLGTGIDPAASRTDMSVAFSFLSLRSRCFLSGEAIRPLRFSYGNTVFADCFVTTFLAMTGALFFLSLIKKNPDVQTTKRRGLNKEQTAPRGATAWLPCPGVTNAQHGKLPTSGRKASASLPQLFPIKNCSPPPPPRTPKKY
jgi:hypothetical protein